MSGLLSIRRAAAPRHSIRAAQPRYDRLLLRNRAGNLAKDVGFVLLAVVILFSAVFLLLAVTSWASNRGPGQPTSITF